MQSSGIEHYDFRIMLLVAPTGARQTTYSFHFWMISRHIKVNEDSIFDDSICLISLSANPLWRWVAFASRGNR